MSDIAVEQGIALARSTGARAPWHPCDALVPLFGLHGHTLEALRGDFAVKSQRQADSVPRKANQRYHSS